MKEISFWWVHWVKGVTMSYWSGDPFFESHVLWKYLHMCKRSVWLKRSCTSNALFFSIILHARIVILASQSLIMLRIKDQVLSQDYQLTLEQYCTWHTVALITFVPSLTVILWLTLFNASATLLPSTKKAEDSPLNEWNYKNKIFSISYWKQSQLLAGLISKKEEMQSEYSYLSHNKITARGKYYYSPAIFYLKHPTHTPVCIFWKVQLFEKHFAPPSVLPYFKHDR